MKQPVWRAVAGVEVVLDHLGRPASRVVIGIQLSSCHYILLWLLFFLLLIHRQLKRERGDNEMIKKRTSCHAQAWTLTLSLSAGWSFCLVLKSFRNQKNIHRAKWKKNNKYVEEGVRGEEVCS